MNNESLELKAELQKMTLRMAKLEDENAALRQKVATTYTGCDCQGWGCTKCCSSEQEIRSRQGTFG